MRLAYLPALRPGLGPIAVYNINPQVQHRGKLDISHSNRFDDGNLKYIAQPNSVQILSLFPLSSIHNVFKMGITTRSGKATEQNDPTLRADDWDLWAFQNHPERWQETFYTNFVDSDEEEGGIIGDEESTIADEGGDSESTAAAMGIDAGMKDGNPNVERDDMEEGSWNYRERDGSALFKGNEMDERDEDPMEDEEADGALAGDNYDQNSDSSEMKFKKFFAPSAEDIEKQGESLRSESADSDGGVGETEDEGTNSLQPDSEDDKAQTKNLDPSIDKENLQIKYTCTCTHCGGKGHNRISCKQLHLPPKFTCTRCGEKGHSRKTCRTEKPGATIGQGKYRCTHCGGKGHGRQACQNLHLPPKYFCPRCGETGHTKKHCPPQKNLANSKPICSYCGEYGHYRHLCPNLHLPPKYICPNCGGLGHSRKDCPLVLGGRKHAYICSNCGEDGHGVNHCPQVTGKKGPERCSYCKEIGHKRTLCPSRPCRYCKATDHMPYSCPIFKERRNKRIAEAKKGLKLENGRAKKGK